MDTVLIRDLVQTQEVEIKTGPFGTQLKASEYVDRGTPVLNVRNLGFSTVNTEKLEMVGNETIKRLSAHTLHTGDIVFGRKGAVERHAFISEFEDGWMQGSDCIRLRVKNERINARYLSYYFLTPQHRSFMLSMCSHGTTMASLNQKIIEMISIPLPERKVQDQVVAILSALDEKIKNNQEINDNLAVLLQTIYQDRFGNDILAVNQGVLSDICSYSRDKVAVSELNVSTYFSTENMLSEKAGSTEATSLPTTSQTTACHKGDTLISNIRPYFKKIVYCEGNCGCSTDVLCFTPSQPRYSTYLFSTLYADKFFAFMVAGSKGTKMPRGDKQQIMTYPVVLPSEEELAGFNTIASPLLKQIYSNRAENKRLSILRDTLLPKLMSGEIDVSAVQL